MFENLKIPKELIPSDPRFGCGPSLVPMSRVEALLKTGNHLLGTGHRHDTVKNMVGEIIAGLRLYFKVPANYDIVMGNGGATFLFDMIPLTMVDKQAAHFTCGEFSQKWYQASCRIPWIKTEEKSVKMGEGIVPTDVPGADLVAVTLNETSTGVQLDQLPKLSAEKILAVDATSGAGQVPCDVKQTDIFYFSPQKVFSSEGGLWIAFLSPKAVERSARLSSINTRYIPEIMRFENAIENSRKNQTYNTPALTSLFFLNEQVKELNVLGYEEVCRQAEKKSQIVYSWAEEKSYLSPFIKESRFRSRSVATVDVDERIKLDGILNTLMKEKYVYGIEGYRKLRRNQLRISLFHNIKTEDLKKLTQLLSFIFEHELSKK